MGKKSEIQWTDATVNFWTGCLKISDGCKFCYMYRDKERYGQDPTQVIRTKPKTFNAALTWNDPKKIFTNSWSDFFIEEADAWRDDAWDIIRRTPQHTWQILTKRTDRIDKCLPPDWGMGWDNVWLGFSAENQVNYNKRLLDMVGVNAKTIFVSIEPLLDRIILSGEQGQWQLWDKIINQIIIGGESGFGKYAEDKSAKWQYRKCELEWIEALIEEAKGRTAVFVKQMGTHLAKELKLKDHHGGDWDEWKLNLKIREFPKP